MYLPIEMLPMPGDRGFASTRAPSKPTSAAAYASIQPSISETQQKVLDSLKRCSATDHELCASLGLNPSTLRPRRGELLDKGLIRDSGETRKTGSGRQAIVWSAA